MDKSEEKQIKAFINKHPKFRVLLDNDMFILQSEPPPDWATATDDQYNKWKKKVKTVSYYINPEDLLVLLIEELGGSVERV